MKYCPQCHKQYTEIWITFCSDDGTILIDTSATPSQQPPPGSRRAPYAPPSEQPTWRSPDPNAPGGWVAPDQFDPIQSPVWQPPPPPGVFPRQQQNQGLAIASMILGLLSFVVGIFCLGPIPGVIALVLGLVALSQIKKDPARNGGKPFAIVGIVTGSISLLLFGSMFFWWILRVILP